MKLLIPIDGSELSLLALQHAIRWQAAGLQVAVVLANVQEPATVYEMVTLHDRAALDEVAQAAGRDALAAAVALAQDAALPAEAVVVTGDPVPMLLEVLEAHQCDGVVMGSHGHGVVGRAWLGSVSQGVLEASPVPVTVVKRPEPETA